MSQLIPAAQLSTSAPVTVSTPKGSACATIVLRNESPYELTITFAGVGAPVSLGPWIMDRFDVGTYPGYGGSFTVAASNPGGFTSSSTTYLIGTVYGAGESVPGTYPIAFARTIAVVNPDRVINDQESYTQQVVEATPFGAFQSTLLLANSGTMKIATYIDTIYTPTIQIVSSADGAAQIVFGGTEQTGVPPQFIGRFYATISPSGSLIFQGTYPGAPGDYIDIYNNGQISAFIDSQGTRTQWLATTPGSGGTGGAVSIGNAADGMQVAIHGAVGTINFDNLQSDAGAIFSDGAGNFSANSLNSASFDGLSISDTPGDNAVHLLPFNNSRGFIFIDKSSGGVQSVAFGVGSDISASLSTGAWVNNAGTFLRVGGLTTAGAFGVPVVVWVVKDWHVSAAGTFTQTFTAPTTGIYRISGRILMNNGTASSAAVNIYVQYTDGQSGITEYVHCSATNSSGTFLVLTDGVTIPMNGFGGFYHMTPAAMEIKANTVVTFTYVIPNTPNDYISFVLEQLA